MLLWWSPYIIYHNELQDITAGLLTELCHNVETKPPENLFILDQPMLRMGPILMLLPMVFGNVVRRLTFSDVKVFNPFAPTHCSISLPQCYRCAELEKKRKYEEWIREVEHGKFSPLVFPCTGGMGPLATAVYSCSIIREEWTVVQYSKTLFWLRFFPTSLGHHLFKRIQIFLPLLWF